MPGEKDTVMTGLLIKGGDLNNAIVYVDKEISEKTMQNLKVAFGKDDISVKPLRKIWRVLSWRAL